jgi:hypothetical protein
MKKTALQWFIENIPELDLPQGKALVFHAKYQQALEKEKEDLIDAHFEGQKECSNEFAIESDARLYFKETFEI